jgi:hypothetical protein
LPINGVTVRAGIRIGKVPCKTRHARDARRAFAALFRFGGASPWGIRTNVTTAPLPLGRAGRPKNCGISTAVMGDPEIAVPLE